jgi:hypothetical protein
MSQLEALAAPVLAPRERNKWRREQEAFRQLLPDLLKSHRDQYVAVHEGRVVEAGPDKLAVAGQAYARFGYVPIYVSLVTDQRLSLSRILARALEAGDCRAQALSAQSELQTFRCPGRMTTQ